MIRVTLTPEQRNHVEKYRSQASSENSEKALMVLLSDEGHSPPKIATMLKRNAHTVRDWLSRYNTEGLSGLTRISPPGRPRKEREFALQELPSLLAQSPTNVGYCDVAWTVSLLADALEKRYGSKISDDTVERSLAELGYTYKRPMKSVPERAPSKKEKQEQFNKMLDEVKDFVRDKAAEIYLLDESHFSSEPYLVRGWFKKRWPPQDSDMFETGISKHIWLLATPNAKILLEAITKI